MSNHAAMRTWLPRIFDVLVNTLDERQQWEWRYEVRPMVHLPACVEVRLSCVRDKRKCGDSCGFDVNRLEDVLDWRGLVDVTLHNLVARFTRATDAFLCAVVEDPKP